MNRPQDLAPHWRVAPKDLDPVETKEWLEGFDALLEAEGPERATFILRKLLDHARTRRVRMPPVLNTPYKNTIALEHQPQYPGQSGNRAAPVGDHPLERAGDGGAREQAFRRAGRAHRQLRLGGGPVRGRLQPLLPRRAGR